MSWPLRRSRCSAWQPSRSWWGWRRRSFPPRSRDRADRSATRCVAPAGASSVYVLLLLAGGDVDALPVGADRHRVGSLSPWPSAQGPVPVSLTQPAVPAGWVRSPVTASAAAVARSSTRPANESAATSRRASRLRDLREPFLSPLSSPMLTLRLAGACDGVSAPFSARLTIQPTDPTPEHTLPSLRKPATPRAPGAASPAPPPGTDSPWCRSSRRARGSRRRSSRGPGGRAPGAPAASAPRAGERRRRPARGARAAPGGRVGRRRSGRAGRRDRRRRGPSSRSRERRTASASRRVTTCIQAARCRGSAGRGLGEQDLDRALVGVLGVVGAERVAASGAPQGRLRGGELRQRVAPRAGEGLGEIGPHRPGKARAPRLPPTRRRPASGRAGCSQPARCGRTRRYAQPRR